MPHDQSQKKRALILAGGGLKVAFQAGVLQVWLDEADMVFDHADGASGGCLNLAMYCQGMSGSQIADNWRNYQPTWAMDLGWEHYGKLFHAPSIFTLDKFRNKILPSWNIDWRQINDAERLGTFNVYNFSKKQLEVKTHDQMNEDFLIASISLPMWFPPVNIDGQVYIDSVYITDANVEEAIRRGADELWAIWTVSTRDEWLDGFIAQYFQIIEAAADTRFFSIWQRIAENNRAIAAGQAGEFGRHIEQKLLQAEVPMHYLLNVSRDRTIEAVNLGVEHARAWCREHGVALKRQTPTRTKHERAVCKLAFTEEMKGYVTPGTDDYGDGKRRRRRDDDYCMFHLTIEMDDVDRFVTEPAHQASAKGWVMYQELGGRLPVEKGVFNLFVHEDDPNRKKMLYRLFIRDRDQRPFTLSGYKVVEDDPDFDIWEDTTTLYARIIEGHVDADEEEGAPVYGSGILKIYMTDFLRQLTTFRVDGPSPSDRVVAMGRFVRLFFGKLWDVYARRFIEYGPL